MATPLSTRHVNAARALATWAIRGVAVTMIAVGLYLVLKRLFFGLGVGFESALTSWEGTGEGHSFYRGLAAIAVGAALAAASRPIARWIVTTPPNGCPGCGYPTPVGAAASVRCPECGLEATKT